MTKIWVMTWDTESGDSGIDGYWTSKPTKKQADAYADKHYPDDFEGECFYYNIEELEPINE